MITYKELKCPGCDRDFKIRLAKFNYELKRRGNKFYCSRGCSNLSRKRPPFSGVCPQCSNEFSRPSGGTRDLGKFCSRSCAARFTSASRKQFGVCKYCDNEVDNYHIICQECKGGNVLRYLSLRVLHDRYSISQYHAKIRGNARVVFQKTGKQMECQVCGYTLHVDVCHIRDVKDFDMSATLGFVNNPDNLITLCKNHHWEFDNGHLYL